MGFTKFSPRRGAFSLIEVLVVIAVLAILTSLLMPAVQAARGAAQRAACFNNLKQIGLAMHVYLNEVGRFPPGYTSAVLEDHEDDGPGWSWGARILPQMEQQNLFRQIDFNVAVESAEAESLRIQNPTMFRCPSDGEFKEVVDIPDGTSDEVVCQMAAASYVACAGTVRPTCKVCRDAFDGVFGRNSAIGVEEIADGLSNTIAVGERSFHWSSPAMWGVVARTKIVDRNGSGKYSAGPGYVLGTTFREGFNIETAELESGQIHSLAESFGSMHPGGATFAFCDGGVRFIKETIDPATFNAISTRAGSPKGSDTIHESPF